MNEQYTKFSQIHVTWDMLLMSLIDTIDKEGAYDKGQEMLLLWAVLKSVLHYIHSKQSEEQQSPLPQFPIDLRAKKIKLTITLTKQKEPMKKKLYIKLSTVLSRNWCTFFVFLLFTYSVGFTTMILECVFFYVGVVISFL